MSLLSVVIPTYNSEAYLSQAIDSVLKQSYKNIELILVDDCSKDNTQNIIKETAKQDNRVKYYFLKENKGPGYARNFGIAQTKGKYLTLVDHDDFQELYRYELMIKQIQKDNSDACMTYSSDFIQEIKKIRKNKKFFPSGNYCLKNPSIYKKFRYSFIPPWSKIIKNNLVKEYNLKFAENNVKYDDLMFHSLFAMQAKTFSVIGKHLYYHRYFSKSITYNFSDYASKTKDAIETFKQTMELAENTIGKEKIINYYMPILENYYRRLSRKDFKLFKNQLTKIFITYNRTKSLRKIKRVIRQIWSLIASK